ncbi:MAG: hypothetical protein PHN74_00695 [Candidatus Pacebacteria bacterium]|nr:hypothetical protein [Candidatus Paceibacterota bacterium]
MNKEPRWHFFIKVLTIYIIVVSNLFFGFPVDYLIQSWNESKIVDNLYWALKDPKTDRERGIVPKVVKEIFAANVAIDNNINTTDTSNNSTSPDVVFTSVSNGYAFYRDSAGDCRYSKTIDGGDTWGAGVRVDSVNTSDCLAVAVWYDQWTPGDTTGTYIHIATIDSGVDDTYYTRLDTSNDSLSTTVLGTTQSGTLAAGTNLVSITKGTNGYLYMTTNDASDSWIVRCTGSCTTASNWAEITSPYTLTNDWPLLMPLASGNIMVIRMELAGNDYDYNIWNGSVWSGWTTIGTTAGENTTYDGHFGATLDKTTNNIYLAYVTDNSTLGTNDDIRTAVYSSGSWTLKTDVLTNDTKGITNAKISFDQNTGNIYVIYSARTTVGTSSTANIYWKKSTDGMASWGSENQLNDDPDNIYGGGNTNIMSDSRIYATWKRVSLDDLYGDTIVNFSATVSCNTDISSTNFNSLTIDSISTASSNAVTTSSCTYSGGCTLYVKDSGDTTSPGLYKSASPTDLILSSTATLIAGTEGYGIQASVSGGSGSALTVSATYDKSSNNVGGLSLTNATLANSTGSYTDRAVTVVHKAAVSYLTTAGSYSDTITYSCVGN